MLKVVKDLKVKVQKLPKSLCVFGFRRLQLVNLA